MWKMASTPPCLPLSLCKQVMTDVPLRLGWGVNALRWSAGSGSGCYCRLQVEFGVLHSARLPLRPCIFHGSVLYSLCASVEDSSLFHFGAFFFNLTWDLFSPLSSPSVPLSSLTSPSAGCISNDIMHLCSPTSQKLPKVSESHFVFVHFDVHPDVEKPIR